MRRDAKKDNNHKAITDELSLIPGCAVVDLSQIKHCCDCIIIYRGSSFYFEIKNPEYLPKGKPPESKLTPGELAFKHKVEGAGGKYFIVDSIEQARRIIYGNTQPKSV